MHIREIRVSYGRRLPVEGQTLNIRNARDVVAIMAPLLEREVVEVCYAIYLTAKNAVIRYQLVSRGTLTGTVVHPREVLQTALLLNAASLVLVHNHPSGHPIPSRDDIAVSRRMKRAGWLMGVELVDHIIIGHQGRWASLRELGLL